MNPLMQGRGMQPDDEELDGQMEPDMDDMSPEDIQSILEELQHAADAGDKFDAENADSHTNTGEQVVDDGGADSPEMDPEKLRMMMMHGG